MNITLSADKETIRRAREVARRQGTSLNALIRSYLRSLGERSQYDGAAEELLDLMEKGTGDMKGLPWNRETLHER